MNEKLLEALGELFIEDSPLYADVKGLMELAIKETRERCAKILENGSFLHDESPAAQWARQVAKLIRED